MPRPVADLLALEERPLHVSVQQTSNGLLVRLDHELPVTLGALRTAALVGVCGGLGMFLFWGMFGGFCMAFTGLVCGGFLGSVGVILFQTFEYAIRQSTVQSLELRPHSVHWGLLGGGASDPWTIHDIEELWASKDWFSGVVACKKRQGGVSALRVTGGGQTRWVLDLLKSWRHERGTSPDPEAQAKLAALGVAARPPMVSD